VSWTQALAAWGMEMGLSAPVAGTLGVLLAVAGPVLLVLCLLGALEAWAASLRRASGARPESQAGSDDLKVPAQRGK